MMVSVLGATRSNLVPMTASSRINLEAVAAGRITLVASVTLLVGLPGILLSSHVLLVLRYNFKFFSFQIQIKKTLALVQNRS